MSMTDSLPAPAAPLRPRHGRRRLAWGLALLVVVGCSLLAWFGPRWRAEARLASAYGARIGCTCHFIAGRPLGECPSDFEPGMGMVTLSVDEAARTVTARVMPLASDSATFRPGQGCVPAAGWR